jgi:hypothetical protein
MNIVFWAVFLGYAYDWPGLRAAAAGLGLVGVVCHTLQVRAIGRLARTSPPPRGRVFAALRASVGSWPPQGEGVGAAPQRLSSLRYTRASCYFGVASTVLAVLLTTGAVGDGVAAEYAYAYAAGAGWFGLYVTGQSWWLLPLLHDDAYAHMPAPAWTALEFPGQVTGTLLVTVGLWAGLAPMVALGAAINLVTAALVTIRSLRLGWARPVMVEN